jgi:hypothetical protein
MMYERQTVEVGGILYTEWGYEPEPEDEELPEPYPELDETPAPVCGMCEHFHPSKVELGRGFCPRAYQVNEWGELENGKALQASDPACPGFKEDIPF